MGAIERTERHIYRLSIRQESRQKGAAMCVWRFLAPEPLLRGLWVVVAEKCIHLPACTMPGGLQ
jgi:hypothetical protein